MSYHYTLIHQNQKIDKSLFQEIRLYETIDSTNNEAKRIIETMPHINSAIIITKEQTSGRGQFNRVWKSDHGDNLMMSLLIKNALTMEQARDSTVLSAMACAFSIMSQFENPPFRLTIKFPNDLMVNQKKLGGILCESKSQSNCIQHLIIGIGINVNWHFSEFPNDLTSSICSLSELTHQHINTVDLGLDISRTIFKYLNNPQSLYQQLSPEIIQLDPHILNLIESQKMFNYFYAK